MSAKIWIPQIAAAVLTRVLGKPPEPKPPGGASPANRPRGRAPVTSGEEKSQTSPARLGQRGPSGTACRYDEALKLMRLTGTSPRMALYWEDMPRTSSLTTVMMSGVGTHKTGSCSNAYSW